MLSFSAFVSTANAALFWGGVDPIAEITCAPGDPCLGLVDPTEPVSEVAIPTPLTDLSVAATSSSLLTKYNAGNAGDQTVVNILNQLTGSSFTTGGFSKIETEDDLDIPDFGKPAAAFTVGASTQYVILKSSEFLGFLKITAPGEVTVTYDATIDGGRGLSFYAAQVPLPAAAWLMLAGLGGLGLISRRRKAASA